jgi:hypothetical protein
MAGEALATVLCVAVVVRQYLVSTPSLSAVCGAVIVCHAEKSGASPPSRDFGSEWWCCVVSGP